MKSLLCIATLLSLTAGCTSDLLKPIGNNLSRPVAISLDPARGRGYVVSANSDLAYETGSVTVLDLSTPTAPTRLVHSANPVAIASHSGQAYLDTTHLNLLIANRDSENDSDTVDQILKVNIDEASPNFLAVASAEMSQNPVGVACCDTASRFYAVAAQGLLDSYTLMLTGRQTLTLSGTTDTGAAVDGLGATRAVILGSQIFVATQLGLIYVINTGEIGTGANPLDYVITGGAAYQGIATDGTLLYAVDTQEAPQLVVVNPASLAAVSPDTATLQEKKIADVRVTQIAVGSAPEEVVVFGGRAYVSNRGSDSISVIDLAAQAVVATIAVGDEPFGLAAGAFTAGNFLYVTNFAANTISVINLATDSVVATFP